MPQQTSISALALQGVSHSYGTIRALDSITLNLVPGELVCLLGPSGCGKTTALRIAAGLEALQAGKVLIDGKVVAGEGRDAPPEQRNVGLVFQDFALFPHLSVFHNVAFGLKGQPTRETAKRVAEVLEKVGMADYAESFPHMLSGGQQQRVALARALAPKPRVMLLDEPFSGLDLQLRGEVRDDTLHLLKNQGTTTLLVTHDPEEAMFMADRIALMREGQIAQIGAPIDLYNAPKSPFVVRFFGEVNRFEAVARNGQVATPFGAIEANGVGHDGAVEVLIRPEALRLQQPDPNRSDQAGRARVLESRLLGRTSLVHLEASYGEGEPLHLHARIPGPFLPPLGEFFEIDLDRRQTFIFPLKH